LLKDRLKAGLATTYLLLIFLFFGNIEDAFAVHDYLVFLSEPKYFLPFLGLISFFILFKIRKANTFYLFHLFLNICLVLLIMYELIMFAFDIAGYRK
jgi:hypothetical protein